MKANDLRIGNYIWNTHGYLQEISAQDIYDLSGYENGKPERCQYFTPIPITENWLKDFGFENINTLNYQLNKFIVWTNIKTKELVFRSYYQPDVIIKHVHQLQNIYFALTGKELTID